MATWEAFAAEVPELAAFGKERLSGRVAYLATVRDDGGPRVHPVTPIVGVGRLYLYMEPTSPKGHDLRRDSRFALHCSVEGTDGGKGEFSLKGRATLVEDPALRQQLDAAATYTPKPTYIAFELSIDSVLATKYEGDAVNRQRWPQPAK